MGPSVGLPEGQMGNSEVGHLNLGAGAIVPQDLARIDAAVEDGTLAENEVLQAALKDAPRVHYIGLVSDGGVHSSDRHLKALIELAAEWGIEDLVVHAFTDGRDTSPTGGAKYLAEVQAWMEQVGAGRIGSVVGRYFAMDRDKRWDRVQKAYDLLAHGKAEHHADSGAEAAQAAYERDETDEFITPTTVGEEAKIRPGDAVLAFNFRPDRMREITLALCRPGRSTEIDRGGVDVVTQYTTLAEYDEEWDYPVVFPPKRPALTIGEVISRAGQGPAARRGDREVPARHVLLQRRRGEALRGRGARARAVPARRPDVRLQARDERARGRRRVREALRRREAGVRDHQLRQPGHGRPHRRDRGRREGGRDRRRVPRPRGRGRARRSAAPAWSPPTTATATTCSTTTARPTRRTR